MAKPIANSNVKWPEQLPLHIKNKLAASGKDYNLSDVIKICEEIIELYDKDMNEKWEGIKVSELMMNTVTFNDKFRRYK